MFLISLRILENDHVRNDYWKFILTYIGPLNVLTGTLIGCVVMA